MRIKRKTKEIFGGARGSGRSDYLYWLLFNANRQEFIDKLPQKDLDVLIWLGKENPPDMCMKCPFFQANSETVSCTIGSKNPIWESVPDDCLLK